MCGGIIVCELDNVSDYFYLPLTQFLPILMLFLASRYKEVFVFPYSFIRNGEEVPEEKLQIVFLHSRHFARFIQQFQTACVGVECASMSR